MTGEADFAYRVPSTDCFQDTRFPSGYDPFQSLSAMAAQTFTGSASLPGSNCQNTHYNGLPSNMQQLNNCASPVTSSSPHYLTTTSSAYCMYSSSPESRRSSDNSTSDDSCQLGTLKKTFPSTSDEIYDEQDGFLSWTRKHPEHWSCKEVLDWLFFIGQEKGLDMSELRGEAFQNINGSQLCRLTEEDFFQIDPKFGKLFYEMLKKMLLNGVVFSKPEVSTPDLQELTTFNPLACDSASKTFQSCSSPLYHDLVRKETHTQPPCTGFQLPDGYMKPERQDVLPCDVIDIGPYDFDLNDPPQLHPQTGNGLQTYQNYCQPEMEIYNHAYSNSMPVRNFNISQGHFQQQLPRRRPGRPRVKNLSDDVARAHKDKKVKNQHLWEFIYEALMNPLYNPQFLRWENQREGVFRFVQSEAVAQLWGSLKSNDNMTYEKLSRAMRHYYKRGILERVEGRRLVYKFSLKAMERVREKRQNSV